MGNRSHLVRVMLTSLASAAVILAVAGGTAMPPFGEAGSGVVLLAPTPSPTTVTFGAVANAYVDNGAPTTNYGDSAHPFASLYGEFSNVRQTLVRFDLSSIPANASVQSARLRLYQQAGSGLSSVTLNLGRTGSKRPLASSRL